MKESVTAVIINSNGELLITKRHNHLRAFPGYTTFPGGKVDSKDRDNGNDCLFSHQLLDHYDAHLVIALQRELQEEIGLDIFMALKNSEIIAISHLGVAVTPDFNPYRYSTHYFKIQLADNFILKVSESINEEMQSWSFISPEEVLGQFNQAEILAVPPTIKLIEQLKLDINHDLPIDYRLDYKEEFEVPMIESIKGVRQFLPLSCTFPPANRTNCFLLGDEFRVVVDPSPKNDEEYKKLNYSLSKIGFHKIFLTHHHPDHVEFSTDLARFHNVPMGMGQDTYDRLESIHSKNWFHDVEVQIHIDGDILTTSLGSDLVLYSTPGHDEGQFCIAPKSLNWCIVGDLIQTIGTVAIGGDEGDMAKYFKSLELIIDMSPEVVFPSHGIAIGGTYKLEQTLEHRKQRESQIKELLMKGRTREEILFNIYPDLEERLHFYALYTIDAHIKKIRSELH
ncbi:MAG: MBL fold metallo-hydrolase [Bacteriovoracaceae bacterium]|nr:MBL fold metallo-hydrolase [Bacteriovoracaceae bacterium]